MVFAFSLVTGCVLSRRRGASPGVRVSPNICAEPTAGALLQRVEQAAPLRAELGIRAEALCRFFCPHSNIDNFVSFFFFLFYEALFSLSFSTFGMPSASPEFLKDAFFTFVL